MHVKVSGYWKRIRAGGAELFSFLPSNIKQMGVKGNIMSIAIKMVIYFFINCLTTTM